MNLYLENGYVDIRKIRDLGLTFNFIVGGRGTGKTYGALKMVKEDGQKFFMLRRIKEHADAIRNPELSPYKKLNEDFGWNIQPFSVSKGVAGFYDVDEEGKPDGGPLGYLAGLTAIAGIRGFDASDVDIIIYDEFIPEKQERKIKHEFEAFVNAYETINRNRELQGQAPIPVLLLANAEYANNALFDGFNLVTRAEKMQRNHQTVSILRDRGIGIFMLSDSPISVMKKNTALGRATKNTDYEKMAVENHFAELDDPTIKAMDLKQYVPKFLVNGICIYQHKSEQLYYVSEHVSGTPIEYGTTHNEFLRFQRNHVGLYVASLNRKMFFENYQCLMRFNEIYT